MKTMKLIALMAALVFTVVSTQVLADSDLELSDSSTPSSESIMPEESSNAEDFGSAYDTLDADVDSEAAAPAAEDTADEDW